MSQEPSSGNDDDATNIPHNHKNDGNDDSEEEKREQREGWNLLLGGLDLFDTTTDDHLPWQEEEEEHQQPQQQQEEGNSKNSQAFDKTKSVVVQDAAKPSSVPSSLSLLSSSPLPIVHHHQAHCLNERGQLEPPPVQIVNLADQRRGPQGLVARRRIPHGATLYTERAAVATQLSWSSVVRACQYCFASLAPASSATAPTGDGSSLPHADELWPVPEYDDDDDPDDDHDHRAETTTHPIPETTTRTTTPAVMVVDQHGRVRCPRSDSWFCTRRCWDQFQHHVGDPALVRRALELVVVGMEPDDDKDNDDDMDRILHHNNNSTPHHKSSLALATRMFAMAVTHYRRHRHLDRCFWEGLCGTPQDLTLLQLGWKVDDNDDDDSNNNNDASPLRYTLQPLYDQLAQLFSLRPTEQAPSLLSLTRLETFAAMAARNGFDVQTQSPFTTYYRALQRRYGRPLHPELQHQVARAIAGGGKSSETVQQRLERGMDRTLNQRVAPDICAMFPLTARINHSCDAAGGRAPEQFLDDDNTTTTTTTTTNEKVNAQVMSQVFVDCHIDLVATRTIHPGQEVLISYLDGGGGGAGRRHKSVHRRQDELRTKYLFDCACPACVRQGTLIFG